MRVAQLCASLSHLLRIGSAVLLLFFGLALSVFAQDVSLLADDTINDLQVTLPGDGGAFTLTVIKDAYNQNQWYYVPKHPRVVERVNGGRVEPVFHLFRYQVPSSTDRSVLVEGGLLQFSATLAIPDAALQLVRAEIARTRRVAQNQIALSALRVRSADVSVYTPGGVGGTFVASPVFGAGAAPTFANQEMSFSVDLTKSGAELFRSLMEGTTGVQLIVNMKYGGLTPPAGFTVTVDYKKARNYYSRDSVFAARASYFGLFGASYESRSSEIRDTLITEGALKIDIIEGSGFTQQEADKYLQPIVKRINDEIIQMFTPPTAIIPAVASQVQAGGFFGSAGYSVATKEENQLRQVKEIINFRVRRWEERTTPVTGFVSVGRYSPETRASLESYVRALNWESAYYTLPPVDVSPELNITAIDLSIGVSSGNRRIPNQLATWRPTTGWRDRNNRPISTFAFALAPAGFTGDVLRNAFYTAEMNITAGPALSRRTIMLTRTERVFEGEKALTTPSNFYDVLKLDARRLSFRDLDPNSDLKLDGITGSITVGEGSTQTSFNVDIEPTGVANARQAPEPVYFIVPRSASGQPGRVIGNLRFDLENGSVAWKSNGDLAAQFPGLVVNLKDYMVRESKNP
jgi:hypothetical protein